jgi:hypothetical protein
VLNPILGFVLLRLLNHIYEFSYMAKILTCKKDSGLKMALAYDLGTKRTGANREPEMR